MIELVQYLLGLLFRDLNQQTFRGFYIISCYKQVPKLLYKKLNLRVIRRDLNNIVSFPNILASFIKNNSVLVKYVRLPDHSGSLRQLIPSSVISLIRRIPA